MQCAGYWANQWANNTDQSFICNTHCWSIVCEGCPKLHTSIWKYILEHINTINSKKQKKTWEQTANSVHIRLSNDLTEVNVDRALGNICSPAGKLASTCSNSFPWTVTGKWKTSSPSRKSFNLASSLDSSWAAAFFAYMKHNNYPCIHQFSASETTT